MIVDGHFRDHKTLNKRRSGCWANGSKANSMLIVA